MRRCKFVSAVVATAALAIAVVQIGFAPTAEAGGGGCHSLTISDEVGASVEVRGFCYEPTVLRIDVGQRVEWTNRDDVPHTISGANFVWGDFSQLNKDQSISFTFDAAGVFPYFCALHTGMVGTVVVGDGQASNARATTGLEEVDASGGSLPGVVWLAPVLFASLAGGTLFGMSQRRTSDAEARHTD